MSTHNMFLWRNKKNMLIPPLIWCYAMISLHTTMVFSESLQSATDILQGITSVYCEERPWQGPDSFFHAQLS